MEVMRGGEGFAAERVELVVLAESPDGGSDGSKAHEFDLVGECEQRVDRSVPFAVREVEERTGKGTGSVGFGTLRSPTALISTD